MKLFVEGTAEIAQAYLFLFAASLTIASIFAFVGLLDTSIEIFFLILLATLGAWLYFVYNMKKLQKYVDEIKQDTTPPLKKPPVSLGMIYLIRLGWIPIGIGITTFWYFFVSKEQSITPLLIAFVFFVIYAIVVVRYLEKRKQL